ncbi:MAG: PEP-CTERM sorting domain-containing protein [Verrucomicrobia bacterium]|nr:PEP-CTERM sorting domain-containing protein [Verrucomicrobiota bacterium]
MRYTLRALQLACVLVVCLFAVSAFADDLIPPPWRGELGSTVQEWDFFGPGVYNPTKASYDYSPDGNNVPFFNPYGDPIAHVWPGVDQVYQPEWGDRIGVWPLSGVIDIEVPNNPVPNPVKEIWIQLTWAQQTPQSAVNPIVTVDPTYLVTGPQVMDDIILGPTNEGTGDGLWHHTTWLFLVEPNPDFEVIRISGTVMVDQIVVDTICRPIPEPATLAILGLGGLAVLLRKRR